MGLSSTYIFNLHRLSLETLVEISPLGLGREFYLGELGIGGEGFVKLLTVGCWLLTDRLEASPQQIQASV